MHSFALQRFLQFAASVIIANNWRHDNIEERYDKLVLIVLNCHMRSILSY